MKKRIAAAVCVLVLACGLMLAGLAAGAADQAIYFMSANDTILDLNDETMPRMVNGTLYVPYTIFLADHAGGVSLGPVCIYSRSRGVLMLYGPDTVLTFHLNEDRATLNGEEYSAKAVIRNSMVFVPVDAVCRLFGLEWSWIIMERGYIIRVKNADVALSDRDFATAAVYAVENRYQKYLQSKAPEQPGSVSPALPTPTPTPSAPAVSSTASPTTTVSPSGGIPEKEARVYLAFRMDEGGGFDEILRQLSSFQCYGVFFCTAEELAGRDDDIRALLAAGHRVGLLLDGATPEEQREQLARGGELLARIASAETAICLSENLSREERTALEDTLCLWTTTLDGVPGDDSVTRHVSRVTAGVAAGEDCFLLLDDSGRTSRALPRILDALLEEGCTFPLVSEAVLQR